MSDVQVIADRVESKALRGEFTDAAMMRDDDHPASLFTHDAVWRMPTSCRTRTQTPSLWTATPPPPARTEGLVIQAPTLVIGHTGDQAAPIGESRRLHAGIPGSRLAEIEGGGHLDWMVQPDQVVRPTREFITNQEG